MKANTSYALRIGVSAIDGRSSAQVVTLSPVDSGSAQVEITSTFVKFNSGSILTIFGNLQASYAVTANWDVRSSSGIHIFRYPCIINIMYDRYQV
jgi:hypothetical protein